MFRPTLAVAADFSKIQYPVFASPKLDGIRCSIVNGKALSRTLKAIPNKAIYEFLSHMDYDGLDGELIVGSPTDDDCYTKTVSKIMAFDKGLSDVTYYVFDKHNVNGGFNQRMDEVCKVVPHLYNDTLSIKILNQALIKNETELIDYEKEAVAIGYEGVILRHPEAPYKFGRSTVNEGYLLKVKRFEDSEAEIVDFEEEMHNGNSAEVNELGRTKRSSAQAGKSGKGTLGAFLVRDIHTGIEFSIGTGLTANQRYKFWLGREALVGCLVKYKYFPVGVKVAPRHPVFLGFRDRRDL